MKKKIWKLIYHMVTPLLIVIVNIIALFSRKIRRGLYPRYYTLKLLRIWLKNNSPKNKRIIFHAASLGEFEHIKPLLIKFKKRFNTTNIVTFFSPSGYDNSVNTKGLDFRMYMPFDISLLWNSLYGMTNPSLLIISKHDIWPVQIWSAKKNNIPIVLLNASLSKESSRIKKIVKYFLNYVYSDINNICAISEEDADRFRENYPNSHVDVVGDTKYDQVVSRKNLATGKKLFIDEWTSDNRIFIAGSIWPEDELYLFPAINDILINYPINIILAPHEPNEKTIEKIKNEFRKWGVITFSEREKINKERIVIIDSVGYLADIYQYASFSYVGGSFKQGIHNVMEAAIYGIPVLYGPVHKNSYEAIRLAQDNGGIIVQNSQEILYWMKQLLEDKQKCTELGYKAEQFVKKNTGITEKILHICQKFIIGE